VPAPGPPAGAEVVPGDGIATFYESNDGGNCMGTGPPADRLDVALSHAEYGTADACGGYLDVTGPRGSVRVLITNQCPECPVGHIDLSSTAFARIADPVAGRVPVSYALVRDPPLAQPIAIRVKDGSSRWWMQIQALDHGNPLATFELQTAGGWRSLVRTEHNHWTAENPGPGDGPFTVRITDIYGQSVTIDGIALAPEQVQRTGARLYGEGSGNGSAAPAPAPTTEPPAPPPSTTVATAPPTTLAPPAPVAPAPAAPAAPARGRGEVTLADWAAVSDRAGAAVPPGALAAIAVAVAAGVAVLEAARRRRSA
jgi:expansin (peptidoglycan-binding protein)